MNTIQTNDFEKRCDMAFEILCLVACKFNKSFSHNEHERLASKYSLEKLEKTYLILKQA